LRLIDLKPTEYREKGRRRVYRLLDDRRLQWFTTAFGIVCGLIIGTSEFSEFRPRWIAYAVVLALFLAFFVWLLRADDATSQSGQAHRRR
jgi:hypothetical protein